MNKEFIPYEQALELKELGFDYYNIAWYAVIDEKPRIVFLNYGGHWKICAPLYQQAFRWFRETHNLFSSVSVDQTMEPKFCYSLSKYADPYDWTILVFNSELYYTYEEAELACLIKLIEIVKNKQCSKNGIKKEGESCTLNNNCIYPNCMK
jgi:hypothetical protein